MRPAWSTVVAALLLAGCGGQFPGGHFSGQVAATVTSVGFFDRIHGQTGVAPNGIELHPLIDVQFDAAGGKSTTP